jgi:hypothetical protein
MYFKLLMKWAAEKATFISRLRYNKRLVDTVIAKDIFLIILNITTIYNDVK